MWAYVPSACTGHIQLCFCWSGSRNGGEQKACRTIGCGAEEGTFGAYPARGYKKALIMLGVKSKWVGATERTWRSLTLLRIDIARRNTVFRVRWRSENSSIGSKGGLQRASNTTARSQGGTWDRTGGLSLSAPQRKRVTRGFLLTDCPPRECGRPKLPQHKASWWSGSTLWRDGPAWTPELYQPGSWLGRAGSPRTKKWKVSTSRRTVSSLRELWIGGWSQQPWLRDQKLWAVPPKGPFPQIPELRVGVIDHRLWKDIPPDRNLPWGAVKERNRVREPYLPDQNVKTDLVKNVKTDQNVKTEVDWPRPGTLSPELSPELRVIWVIFLLKCTFVLLRVHYKLIMSVFETHKQYTINILFLSKNIVFFPPMLNPLFKVITKNTYIKWQTKTD